MRYSKLCVCWHESYILHTTQTNEEREGQKETGTTANQDRKWKQNRKWIKEVSGGEVKLPAGNVKHSKFLNSEGSAPFMRMLRYLRKMMSHLCRSYDLNTRATNSVINNRWRLLAAMATGNRNEFRGGNGEYFRKVKWRGKRDKINEYETFTVYY